jgi:hypothetical protein
VPVGVAPIPKVRRGNQRPGRLPNFKLFSLDCQYKLTGLEKAGKIGRMTNPDKFVKRLCQAYSEKSLRELGNLCGVSHELIRKITASRSLKNISMSSYEKIDKGLRKNGF